MNRDRLSGLSTRLGGKLMEVWGAIVRDPQAMAAGRRAQMAGRVQEQRGLSRQIAERQLADFMRRNRNWSDLSGS